MGKTVTNQVSSNLTINEINFLSIVASELEATNGNFVNLDASNVETHNLTVNNQIRIFPTINTL